MLGTVRVHASDPVADVHPDDGFGGLDAVHGGVAGDPEQLRNFLVYSEG